MRAKNSAKITYDKNCHTFSSLLTFSPLAAAAMPSALLFYAKASFATHGCEGGLFLEGGGLAFSVEENLRTVLPSGSNSYNFRTFFPSTISMTFCLDEVPLTLRPLRS